MTGMYLIQTMVLGGVLLWLSRCWIKESNEALAGVAFVFYWTLAVMFVFLWQGDQQSIFYSSDQVEHLRSVAVLQRDGISLSIDTFLGRRYIISVPASILADVGVSPILAYKFLQGLSVIVLLSVVSTWANHWKLQLRQWQIAVVIGPSLLLNSVLALRDSVLAAACTMLLLARSSVLRLLAFITLFGLRPQLAIALGIGVTAAWIFSSFHRTLWRAFISISAFAVGKLIYDLASRIFGGAETPPILPVFSIRGILRLLSSFLGVQFLTVNPDTVTLDFRSLLVLRVIFFDTWVAPLLFLASLLAFLPPRGTRTLQSTVLYSFCVYVGIASQTNFTSSRQSLPFFAVFVCTALLGRHTSRGRSERSLQLQ